VNYWKYLRIIGSGLIVAAVVVASLNAGDSSTKPSVETGTKFNF